MIGQIFQWNPKIYIKIETISPRAIKKVDGDPPKSWPQFWQFWTLDDCNVGCCCYGSHALFLTLKNKIQNEQFFRVL